MLTLFSSVTKELSPVEKEILVPMLIDTLYGTTVDNPFKGRWLCDWFKQCGHAVSGSRLRKLVHYIRVKKVKQGLHHSIAGSVVIGTESGYYLTANARTIQDQIDSLCGRIDSQSAVVNALKEELTILKKTAV